MRRARADGAAADPVVADLTCPLCMDLPEGEIVQCTNGHIFCADCLKSHRESGRPAITKCPTCRVDLGQVVIRNRIAEVAVGQLPGPCGGCGEEMLRKDLAAHTATCGEVYVQCPFPGCTTSVKRKDLAAHHEGAAAAHLALAQAQAKDLEEKRALLASLDVRIHVKTSGARGTGTSILLKRFEKIDEQQIYRTELRRILRTFADVLVRGFTVDLDSEKTPHDLGLRDGATITVTVRTEAAINIKLVTRDGAEIFFKMKQTTQFEKVFRTYGMRQGVAVNALRFLFDGNRINPNQTPADLGMEDGDTVDVVVA